MNKFLKLTIELFCFILLPLTVNAGGYNYANQQKHYSFTIPSDWVEIPKSTIDESMQSVVDQTDGQFIDYTAGFQIKNTKLINYPYILVQEHKINTPSYIQITKTLGSDKVSDSINKKFAEYSELMSNASIDDPFVDKERNIIFINTEIDVVNIGKVRGLTAIFLGKESITQLNFYSIKSKYSENLPTFNLIIDSFKYEQGYEYNKEEAKNNDSLSIFEGTIEKGVIGAITGGLIALIFGLFARLKKNGDKK